MRRFDTICRAPFPIISDSRIDRSLKLLGRCAIAFMLLVATPRALAEGRLLATGGASQIEGTAGGGLVPWAVLSGYATEDETSAAAFYTHVSLPDYALDDYGVAVTLQNRVEISIAQQRFDLGTLGKALDRPGAALRQDIYGLKWRLAGDVLYGAMPELSLGVAHKQNLDFALPESVGARAAQGNDLYLAATQLLLARADGYNLLWNLVVRSTDANQFGLLGFGGDRGGRRWVGEGSVAVLFNPNLAVGAEYRQKPNNLGFAREDSAGDLFVAWFPSKHISVVAAYASLGSIAGLNNQRGCYLSLQGSL